MSCSDAVARLWDHLEREGRGRDPALDEHLSACRNCCGEAEFAGMLRDFLVEHADDDPPPEVSARLETFLDELEGAS